ncbi:hypothetical protein MKK68_04475 [Methylobacterium sp. E-016]|uniref:hypothetical protein n=1 Tax=Methylobacterium sp. E-016 TaxID=2836556 RepID=UPI001FBBE6A5|nr:hypothetical protein [Methylobacterium sp. E-016]MCJ2074909.1 hypothetical protein [Methylobacterium sp. E-016]
MAIELVPLSRGQWMVREIKGVKNRSPTPQALRAILGRLHALGAVSPGSICTERTRELSSLLGVFRWNAFDFAALELNELEEALETREAA